MQCRSSRDMESMMLSLIFNLSMDERASILLIETITVWHTDDHDPELLKSQMVVLPLSIGVVSDIGYILACAVNACTKSISRFVLSC